MFLTILHGRLVLVNDYALANPTYLGVITGLDITDARAVYNMVRDCLEPLLSPILDIAAEEDEDIARDTDRTVFKKKILDSLQVSFLDIKIPGGTATPEFNVYARLPIEKHKGFLRARSILTSAVWRGAFLGRAGFREPYAHWCLLCHGADHPRGLCPLPTTPGWLGPTTNGRRNEDGDAPGPLTRDDDRRPEPRRDGPSRLDRNAQAGPSYQDGSRKRRTDHPGRADRSKAPRRFQ
ncbi:hypothetical protein EIP86_000020 [Pleurotus ostreatoroseus]|nr:hypothetical protein EIP86_000020 [Pleurotus ostreatoroseus]